MKLPLLLSCCALLAGCFGAPPPDPPCSDWAAPTDRPTEIRITRNMSRRPTEVWREALDSAGDWVRHGRDVKYFLDGQVKAEENWKMGVLDGPADYWFPNGRKQGATVYLHGLPEGRAVSWREDGSIESEKNWKSGKLEGWYRHWNTHGVLDREQFWVENHPAPRPEEMKP